MYNTFESLICAPNICSYRDRVACKVTTHKRDTFYSLLSKKQLPKFKTATTSQRQLLRGEEFFEATN